MTHSDVVFLQLSPGHGWFKSSAGFGLLFFIGVYLGECKSVCLEEF